MNCTHCGSKYTEFKRTSNDHGKIIHSYYCQSCKRSFSAVAAQATGQWLMTLRGDPWGRQYRETAEIYKTDAGAVELLLLKHDTWKLRQIRPAVNTEYNPYTGSYYASLSTFLSPNDPEGQLFGIEQIELKPELTQKALENEAMKALHSSENIFLVGSKKNKALIDDTVSWIRSNLGSTASRKSGCYIATCVYGSYDCPEVWTLRRFRDNTLAATWFGRALIKLYYAVSPTLVQAFGQTSWFRTFWKQHLDKAVANLQAKGVEATQYTDRHW